MQVPFDGLSSNHVAPPQPFNPLIRTKDHAAGMRNALAVQPAASQWSISVAKRILDFSVALACVLLLATPMLILAFLVRMTSKGPAFFVQKRVGRGGHLFGVYKFRSMSVGSGSGLGITKLGDSRVTEFGRIMRKFKLDELPQLFNILRGEMSLVGPRPKLPRYEPMTDMPYRPGITGAATLAFRHEEDILSGVHPSQVDSFYAKHIMPLKAQIDAEYMNGATLWSDIRLIAATFFSCLNSSPHSIPFKVEERLSVNDSISA